jgi:RsiW-degrading membrane proteinase PrsW (M82 family)
MNRQYRPALVILAVGLIPLALSLFAGTDLTWLLLLPATALPVAVLLAVRARFGLAVRPAALLGGGVIAPLIAIASQPLVAAFAYAFFLGFAGSGRQLFEALRVDPPLTTALASPWVILMLVEVALVVPIVEELAKATGASLGQPRSRQQAFLAGVTAGCAFAAIENILYVGSAALSGGPWQAVAAIRMLSGAVHPLATGLTMLGYREWKARGDGGALLRGYLSAVGVHMLWNGSTIVAGVVATDMFIGSAPARYGVISLTYVAMLGVSLAAALWQVARTVAGDADGVLHWELNSGEALGAWIVLASTLLVPVSILLLAFPGFYRG